MKKTRKFLSSLLACLLAFTCIASVATVSASAVEEPYCSDVDYYNQNISENMDKYLLRWLERFFTQDCQVGGHAETFIFVDYELINYGFLNHICQALSTHFDKSIYWGNIHEQTGIRFWLDYGNGWYCDLEQWQCTGELWGFDFSDADTFDAFCDTYVNEVNMFAVGVWYPGDTFCSFLMDIQDAWNDNFPIYFIYRDSISLGSNGLLFLVYDSLEHTFYYCYEAPGATY